MALKESDLKKQLTAAAQPGALARVYFLYGDEPYLTAHYARRIAEAASGDGALAEFNLQRLDGGSCKAGAIEEAVEALPVMAERKCVVVRDYNAAKSGADDQKRLLALLGDLPESCVLVFWQDAVPVDLKGAKWKAFAAAVDKAGVRAELNRKSESDVVRLLTSGAGKRGCVLSPENARLMLERCGNDMALLLGELDKLAAAALSLRGDAAEAVITAPLIRSLGTETLDASVNELVQAVLRGRAADAYGILHRLYANKEDSFYILGALSNTYVDMYRVKVALAAGDRADGPAAHFNYRGREFRLRNAARDAQRLPPAGLRRCLDTLADASRSLKSSMDDRVVMEQTVARLILLAKEGVPA